MKRGFILIFTAILCVSCKKNFLDKAPGSDRSEDSYFQNKNAVETTFIPTIYLVSVPSLFSYDAVYSQGTTTFSSGYNVPLITTSVFCDEGEDAFGSGTQSARWNSADDTAADACRTDYCLEDARFFVRWTALRHIALMFEKIDGVPNADDAYKNQIKGEMHTLRASLYYEMLKRYGGMPIITERYPAATKIVLTRNTFEECVNFIVSQCDSAINNANLPEKYDVSQTGRVTKTVARFLKAKTLLYAASPLFNTASPVLGMSNTADNKLICYGNFDANRWKLAADAARDALTNANANGYALIDVVANRNPADVPGSKTPGPVGNYRSSWEDYNNSEILLGFQGPVMGSWTRPYNNLWSRAYAPTTGTIPFVGGNTPTLGFVKKYRKLTDEPQTWDVAGGSDLLGKIAELDPRFKQTFAYTTSYYTDQFPYSEIWAGGANVTNCFGGFWMRKYFPRTLPQRALNDPVYRLNDLYLILAEAINESDGPTAEAYSAINAVRQRSAMPPLSGLTQTQLRIRIRDERAVELAMDDQRFFDVKRWLIAEEEGVMKGDMWGLTINKVSDTKFNWTPYVFEKRSVDKKMYFTPLPLNEVLKGGLVQNPGY